MGALATAAELHISLNLLFPGSGRTKKGSSVICQQRKASIPDMKSKPLRSIEVREIRDKCRKWAWKGQYSINFFVSDSESRPPLLLVHGFGASIPHWRRNIATLSQNYTVYAIDLLGFGASDKPKGFAYTMEAWAELILDFLHEVIQKPTVLIGNSVGSLACVIAASESRQTLVRGLVLLNCAGGMNNKAIVDDWRIKLLLPLLLLIDFLLKQRVIASTIFERVKQRDTLKNILLSVYGDKDSVDEELVEIIRGPANDEVLWGDQDPFTPIDGPVGKYFSSLPSQLSNVRLYMLEGVGHCPHDDKPDLVHGNLLPWLADVTA
ncbi:pheophytinase, chloroplastic isoform X2 [Hevea brasiliensis]|uniref:pheophytinase, chloroplastic isoform X2 n=1 Tax=Hevea brasiliensis TaxID=3981 RepID=UPI0025E6B300|nr:pheophytinase, chloroplastic isoform X2 [Hevea brasiliensis]